MHMVNFIIQIFISDSLEEMVGNSYHQSEIWTDSYQWTGMVKNVVCVSFGLHQMARAPLLMNQKND